MVHTHTHVYSLDQLAAHVVCFILFPRRTTFDLLPQDFLVRHPELGWTYNAVQLRAEMVLNYRYLSPTCNDTGVYQWFQTLRSQISTWNGTWFRAKDLKKGGSRTLKRYDNESMQRLVELERDLWRDSPVTFIENECEGATGQLGLGRMSSTCFRHVSSM